MRFGAYLMMIANGCYFLTQLIASIFLARLLTPYEMGMFGVVLAVQSILQALQNIGIPSYIIREPNLSAQQRGTAFLLATIQAVLTAGFLLMLAPLVGWFMQEKGLFNIFGLVAISAFFSQFEQFGQAYVQRSMRFDRIALLVLVKSTLTSGVTLVLAYQGAGAQSMAIGLIAGVLGALVFILIWVGRQMLARPTLAAWQSLWRFGAPILYTVWIFNLFWRLNDVVLGRLAGLSAVGLYGRANGVLDMMRAGLLEPLGKIMFSTFVQHRDHHGHIRDAYLQGLSLFCGLLWPAYLGLAVLATPLIHLLYGLQWVGAGPVLTIIALAMMINQLTYSRDSVLMTFNQGHLMPRKELVIGLFSLSSFALGAYFNMVAAAASTVLASTVGFVLYFGPVRRLAGFSNSAYVKTVLSCVIPTLAAVAPAIGVQFYFGGHVFGDSANLPVPYLFGAIFTGVLAWLGALFATKHPLSLEIRHVLTKALRL
jgi:O-antigen/teichoic acid export membrane protein